MHSNVLVSAILAVAIAALSASGSVYAGPPPQDTNNAIDSFDILGVKLGMTETQAAAAVRQRFPAVKATDLILTNPASHNPVRSGIRFNFDARPQENFNFLKIYIANGKVWAVWRNDLLGSYPYESTSADMGKKYAGASAIIDPFDVAGNPREAGKTKGTTGYELYKGSACDGSNPPFTRVNTSDSIRLNGGCSKLFRVNYGGMIMGGEQLLRNGSAQLVDLDAGRAFLSNMGGDTVPQSARAKL